MNFSCHDVSISAGELDHVMMLLLAYVDEVYYKPTGDPEQYI